MALSTSEQTIVFQIARSSITTKLAGNKFILPDLTGHPGLLAPLGAFVTLKINGQLRGCIGIFESQNSLAQTIADMAREAAFNDTRFSPLTWAELPPIKIEISVLTPMKKITNPNQIVLGKHGVYIRQGRSSGVYLPQVATEMNWSRETFLSSLCAEKAGLPADCWRDTKTEMFIFEAEVFREM